MPAAFSFKWSRTWGFACGVESVSAETTFPFSLKDDKIVQCHGMNNKWKAINTKMRQILEFLSVLLLPICWLIVCYVLFMCGVIKDGFIFLELIYGGKYVIFLLAINW